MTRFDLHIHTALSPCAENVMSPRQIITRAKAAGLDIIAITDHNASANVETTIAAGRESGIRVIPGIEVSSLEEVHVLGYFETFDALADFQAMVDKGIPEGENISDVSGYQLVFDSNDEISDIDEKIRNIGINIPLDKIVAEIQKRNGLAVPAHVFKKRYSIISQLGFIDLDAGYDALEVQSPMWIHDGYKLGRKIEGYPAISGSDSHFLESVGRFHMEIPETTDNLKELFKIISKHD
jgi:predicted metal-dependent phosphoesterase TrpH